MLSVLFLCVHNAGRSQMAAGWLRSLAGTEVTVLSAGSAPADAISPVARQAMAEVGIDVGAHSPQRWTDSMASEADIVVTMGCGDSCPTHPAPASSSGRYLIPPEKGSTRSDRSGTESETRFRTCFGNSFRTRTRQRKDDDAE